MLTYNVFCSFYDSLSLHTLCRNQFTYAFPMQYTPIWLPHTDIASSLPFSRHPHFCHTERYSMHLHIRRIFAFSPHDSHSFRVYTLEKGYKKWPIRNLLIGLSLNFFDIQKAPLSHLFATAEPLYPLFDSTIIHPKDSLDNHRLIPSCSTFVPLCSTPVLPLHISKND